MAKNKGDSTIKFLIYILLFLIFILVMLLMFIIPSIKGYKSTKSDLKTYQSQNKHLLDKRAKLEKELEEHKKTHEETIKTFARDFNKTEFLTFAGKYFHTVSLSDGEEKQGQSQFRMYMFSAISLAKDPTDFYHFIDELEKYPSVIKINFPITLVSKGDNIHFDFNMSIYQQDN